ncbi:MAG TPA: AEC family transporter [bacterium]|nr:AEC family transporter [bacterium]
MELLALLGYAVPVAIPLGYLSARWRWLNRRRTILLTALIVNFLLPLFMFYSLSQSTLTWGSSGVVALAALLMPLVSSLITRPLARWRGVPARERILPMSFPNTGNLGVPLSTLLFGRTGMELSVMFALIIGLLHYSYGVALVGARGSIRQGISAVLHLPLFYAAVTGLLLNGYAFDPLLARLLALLALPAFPCMLFLLGASLHNTCLPCLRDAAWWAGWKYGISFGIVALLIMASGASGITASVLLLSAGLPSAVATILLTRRYDADPVFASTMVALTTLLTAVIAPGVWLLARALGFC